MKWMAFILTILRLTPAAMAAEPVTLLKELVEISSGSANLDGVNSVQKRFAKELQALGFKIELRDYPQNKYAKLLIATFTGTEKKPETKFITFLVHADTVFEKSSGFIEFKMSADKKTATGPGVIDDKGGMVVALEALKEFLKKNPQPHFSLRVVSSPAEEAGTPELFETDQQMSKDSELVLGFEPALENGFLIDSRRGNRWYTLKVTGREAHAGRAHKEGLDACWELARKLDKISQLTNYKKDLTISIGHIEGGKDKFNIVCGEASAKIDMRFTSLQSRDQADQKILKIVNSNSVKAASDQATCTSEIKVIDDTSPFEKNKNSVAYIQALSKIIASVENRKISSQTSGGAADSNYFARPGLPIIDGLGPVGGKMHTSDEFIELSSLTTRAHALAVFLEAL